MSSVNCKNIINVSEQCIICKICKQRPLYVIYIKRGYELISIVSPFCLCLQYYFGTAECFLTILLPACVYC